ncbi:Globin, structural domain-containing protein [Strongyloides ratti]|uniref:Globin, structural domain-containing protein n=1 Tax=Strongyloides ratti TaxID=34506 RepID=A0A090KYX5_STRRB|nr:Globin, structural domain-containing protein [Strongyloides ratti]CEF61092.1 Globin, structural domain-containing protein [Strongyloides ratti]
MGNAESSQTKIDNKIIQQKKSKAKSVTIGKCETTKISNDRKRSSSFNEVDIEASKNKMIQKQNLCLHRNSVSFNSHIEKLPITRVSRRAKSFRVGQGNTGSFTLRNHFGPAAELTTIQKKIIHVTLSNVDVSNLYLFGHLVFSTIFSRDKKLLQVIGLENFQNSNNNVWEQHINFKLHIQHFCETLLECVEHIYDNSSVLDRLREFGASYALNQNAFKGIPMNFWDRLQAAIFNAARELKYFDGRMMEVSLLSDNDQITNEIIKDKSISPNISISSATSNFNYKTIEINSDTTSTHSSSDIPPLSPYQKTTKNLYSQCGSILSNNRLSFKKKTKMSSSLLLNNSSGPSLNITDRFSPEKNFNGNDSIKKYFKYSPLSSSICPLKAQAWGCFSLFLAEQIRFGYELEVILQDEMKRLGLKDVVIEDSIMNRNSHSPKQKTPFYTVSC